MPIDEVRVQGVRGVRGPLTVRLAGKSLLLYGSNGSGKSSIEQALRWALMGENEPTEEEPFTTESSYRRHVAVAIEYPAVEVLFCDGSRISVTHEDVAFSGRGEDVRAACRRGVPFLRRNELLRVLSAKPSDRFRYLESFLGLEPVDRVIRGLADRRAEIELRLADLRRDLSIEISALLPRLPDHRRSAVDDLPELERQAIGAAVDLGLLQSAEKWDEAYAAVLKWSNARTEEDLSNRRVELRKCSELIEQVKNRIAGPPPDPVPAEERCKQFEGSALEADELKIITHALSHFRRKEGQSCPVCGQEIDWSATRRRLERRSEALADYAEALRERDEAIRLWLELWDEFREAQSLLESIMGREVASIQALAELPAALFHLDQQAALSPERTRAMLALGGAALGAYLREAIAEAAALAADASAHMPKKTQLPDLLLLVPLFTRLGDIREELQRISCEALLLERQAGSLSAIHQALRHARQDVASETLDSISGQVRDYYSLIHPEDLPEETTGAPEIVIQRHGGGTAFVRGQFAAQSVSDPQWIYSDGHLDTVGICIFLALRRYRARHEGDPKILILDDVVLSIDLGHARRIIDLLRDFFSDHQIVIMTHNGLFSHWCSRLLPGVKRLEIKSWTLEDGPKIGDHSDSRGRLLELLETASAKEIALSVMRLMDEWLVEARYEYALAVPARVDERYTLGDIWYKFVKVAQSLARQLKSDLGGATLLLGGLRDHLPLMRNALAAHENEFAREYPREVVVEVARSAVALVDCFYCVGCCGFVKPFPDLDHCRVAICRCGSLVYGGTLSTQDADLRAMGD